MRKHRGGRSGAEGQGSSRPLVQLTLGTIQVFGASLGLAFLAQTGVSRWSVGAALVRQSPLSSVYGSFAADVAFSMAKRSRPGSAMVALILAVGAILSCGQALRVGHKADPARPEHVIMISVDGMAP